MTDTTAVPHSVVVWHRAPTAPNTDATPSPGWASDFHDACWTAAYYDVGGNLIDQVDLDTWHVDDERQALADVERALRVDPLDRPLRWERLPADWWGTAADGGVFRARLGDTLDLVGVHEAARIAGISRDGIHQARRRGTMPAPIPVAGTDVIVWRRADVEAWAATRRGRGRPRSG